MVLTAKKTGKFKKIKARFLPYNFALFYILNLFFMIKYVILTVNCSFHFNGKKSRKIWLLPLKLRFICKVNSKLFRIESRILLLNSILFTVYSYFFSLNPLRFWVNSLIFTVKSLIVMVRALIFREIGLSYREKSQNFTIKGLISRVNEKNIRLKSLN